MDYIEDKNELNEQLADIIIDNGYELDISELDFMSYGMPVTSVSADENGEIYFYTNETIDGIPVELQLDDEDYIELANQIIENYQ